MAAVQWLFVHTVELVHALVACRSSFTRLLDCQTITQYLRSLRSCSPGSRPSSMLALILSTFACLLSAEPPVCTAI